MVEPNAWLADFEARAAAAKEKAAQFQESLSTAGAAASSADGLVTVTVAPNGSLADLRISDAAVHGTGARLAAEILRTAREAQRRAAGNVLTAFTALGGADSDVTKMLTGFVPPPEPDPYAADDARFLPPSEPTAPPPPAFTPPTFTPPVRREPQGQPVRRTARPADDDDDRPGGSVLGSSDW
ncbi:MAG TPA: YbaB/EbfC family nucleoid-associated protein [Pseudonocardiaceae bacterium]|jgi:DNA-binding protein YbaB|nr:YbaB/EbfC family nucleoid-associated protein [Pseudonocardiaceae bacterium]